jgi:Tol biopolymer transport system component
VPRGVSRRRPAPSGAAPGRRIGRQVAFESNRNTDQRDFRLWVMGAGGADQRMVSPTLTLGDTPSWSPDGARLAFTGRGPAGLALRTVRADGKDERQLVAGLKSNCFPQWAPDGRRPLYTEYEPGATAASGPSARTARRDAG